MCCGTASHPLGGHSGKYLPVNIINKQLQQILVIMHHSRLKNGKGKMCFFKQNSTGIQTWVRRDPSRADPRAVSSCTLCFPCVPRAFLPGPSDLGRFAGSGLKQSQPQGEAAPVQGQVHTMMHIPESHTRVSAGGWLVSTNPLQTLISTKTNGHPAILAKLPSGLSPHGHWSHVSEILEPKHLFLFVSQLLLPTVSHLFVFCPPG